ncbi:UNVERIFIED_CONTAM: hypothetical protein Sangu_3102600 [Sesamum angustifolium]|uniref:Retrotransposon gag domain-containing protein n=1 Tax=Sesamum angustifolium TaxID=2727405 RepID=A0AAW2K846_9LAMI
MVDQTSSCNHVAELESQVKSAVEEASILTDAVEVKVDGIQIEVNLLKCVIGRDDGRAPMSKVKVPDLKPFGGARSAKELENFLWDMETYFQAAHIPEAEKVSITSTVRDYVKDFSSLMLDIRDMSKEDKLFNFLSGLQTWAQTELRHQGVKDLLSTIVAADWLVYFRVTSSFKPEKKKKDSGKEKGKSSKGWKDGKFKRRRTRKGRKIRRLPNLTLTRQRRVVISAMVTTIFGECTARKPPNRKGLMYVRVQINGKAVMTMLDTGATHNFVVDREIQKLRLALAQHSSRIKAMNSEAKPIQGVACVELKGASG